MNTFSYCDFFNSTIDGESMNDSTKPKIWGEFNISWPPGWTEEKAKEYRIEHGMRPPSQS